MKRIIRSCLVFAGVCLVFCACARAKAPPVIFNEVAESSGLTLENNLAAHVWVYCLWRNALDNDTTWDFQPGVIIDKTHVLTKHCDWGMLPSSGWEMAHLESRTIGLPDVDNKSGRGPWKARRVAEDSDGNNFEILATDSSMPLPSVVPSLTVPKLGDLLYTVYSNTGDDGVNTTELLVVSVSADGSDRPDFSVIMSDDECHGCPQPSGIFNQQNEFVGFITNDSPEYFTVPLQAPEKFKGKNQLGLGYDVAATGKTLKPLLRQINISWAGQP